LYLFQDSLIFSQINLIDFGATREFSKEFMDMYVRILKTAQTGDEKECAHWSTEIGFLTGEETKVFIISFKPCLSTQHGKKSTHLFYQAMVDAHVKAVMILGEPFRQEGIIDFGSQDMSPRVQELIPIMLKHRLRPPPDETYSLHRKLSGAFLLCTKLRAKISCKQVFDDIYSQYEFGGKGEEKEEEKPISTS
jgi:aarF domain-containing kinase